MDERRDQRDQAPAGETPQDGTAEQPLKGLAAGYILVAALLIGVGLGWVIDRKFDTAPWWTVGLGAVFIVAGLYHVVRDYSK